MNCLFREDGLDEVFEEENARCFVICLVDHLSSVFVFLYDVLTFDTTSIM